MAWILKLAWFWCPSKAGLPIPADLRQRRRATVVFLEKLVLDTRRLTLGTYIHDNACLRQTGQAVPQLPGTHECCLRAWPSGGDSDLPGGPLRADRQRPTLAVAQDTSEASPFGDENLLERECVQLVGCFRHPAKRYRREAERLSRFPALPLFRLRAGEARPNLALHPLSGPIPTGADPQLCRAVGRLPQRCRLDCLQDDGQHSITSTTSQKVL